MITIVYPPRPGSTEEYEDLQQVIRQHRNNVVPRQLQRKCDEDATSLFIDYLANRGINVNNKKLKAVKNSCKIFIMELKESFDRPRPDEVAQAYGIDWDSDYLESAQTPSYPSGHTTQAYVCAGWLSNQYPEHSKGLFTIAEVISQSRIDRGVHFPSDVDYGRIVAKDLLGILFSIS